MAQRKAAFLDRDGVIIRDFGYVCQVERLEFMAGVIPAIRDLNARGYLVIIATNQSGIARGLFTVDELLKFHDHMLASLTEAGARIDDIFWCPYHPAGSIPEYSFDHEDRKPQPGMLIRAIDKHKIDRRRSFMIGDKESDLEAARGAGIIGYLYDASETLDKFVQYVITNTAT